MPRIYCRSLYAYSGEHDQALKFEVGEIIEVLQSPDGGWWEGEIDEVRGWFPANYVRILEVSQEQTVKLIRGLTSIQIQSWITYVRKQIDGVCK